MPWSFIKGFLCKTPSVRRGEYLPLPINRDETKGEERKHF